MDVSFASQWRLQTGMKIEKEWEEVEKVMKKNKVMKIEDEDNDDTNNNSNKDKDTLPFACFIWKEPKSLSWIQLSPNASITSVRIMLFLCSTIHHARIQF